MNFNNIRYFLTLCEEMHFGRAAEKLFISEQALSNTILRLEKEFNVSFFERSPKLKLTSAGRVFFQKAKALSALECSLHDEIADVRTGEGGTLTIGTTRARGNILLPRIVPAYLAKNPKADLIIKTGASDSLQAMLMNNQIDLMINSSVAPLSGIQQDWIMSESLSVIVSKSLYHLIYPSVPLQDGSDGLPFDLTRFSGFRFLLAYDGLLQELSMNLLSKFQISPKNVFVMNDTNMLVQLACQDVGIAIVFSHYATKVLNSLSTGNVAYCFQADSSSPKINVSICYRKERYVNHLARSFIQIAKEEAANL